MKATVDLLVIAQDPAQFLRITRHLREHGMKEAVCVRATGAAALETVLTATPWTVVLVVDDWPGAGCEPMLESVRCRRPGLPVILICDAVDQARAAGLLRGGVAEIVLKDDLGRLVPAIERCLREAALQHARQAAEAALRASEQRLHLALAGGDLGLWEWDPASDTLAVDARWARMLGYEPDELPPPRVGWDAYLHPDDAQAMRAACAELLEERRFVIRIEQRLRHRHGHWVWVLARAETLEADGAGRPRRVCGTHQDIGEHKRLELALTRLTVTDPLTGTFNRRQLLQTMQTETQRVRRYDRPLAAILLDLDRFQAVNDVVGRARGDEVLAAIAAQAAGRLRRSDSLARWEGDGFLILLPETTLAQAVTLAEALRAGLHTAPCPGVGPVTASFGVAQYQPEETPEQWLARVAGLVMLAKAEGRDRVAAARPPGGDPAQSLLPLA